MGGDKMDKLTENILTDGRTDMQANTPGRYISARFDYIYIF
jgi:hypothetical protein